MIKHLQAFIGAGTNPHRNLAIEEYLTDTVPEDTLIVYLWQNKHTVVIGRNQNAWAECRTAELERDGGTLARRLSGGGAVYHDMGNLNFTFSLRTEDYDLRRQQSVIVEACRMLGIPAEISGRNDILTNGCKFSGNSFYSHNGCSFHNGTLLLSVDMANLGKYLTPSKVKLESKGVASVRSRVINLTELVPTLTVAQTIKLAAALHQLDRTGEVSLTNGGSNWYENYVNYAVTNGIIEKDYANYTKAQMNAPVTRGEFVHIFHGAEEAYKAINTVADNAIPDVKATDKFAAEIYEFYRAGILTGSDAKGTFHSASTIKRSEAAAILLRMFEASARVSIDLP